MNREVMVDVWLRGDYSHWRQLKIVQSCWCKIGRIPVAVAQRIPFVPSISLVLHAFCVQQILRSFKCID